MHRRRVTAVLLAILLGLGVLVLLLRAAPDDESRSDIGPRRVEESAPVPPLLHGRGAGEGSHATAPGGDGEAPRVGPGAETIVAETAAGESLVEGLTPAGADVVASYEGAMPAGWAEAPAAQRPHAIRPPGGRRVGPGGGSGGPSPTGHWSKFPPPPPPSGEARLEAMVVDSEGRPMSGADVYLLPPPSLREAAVSFGDIRRLGKTGEDGRLVAEALPAGAAALAANFQNQLNGRRGLDARSSIPVLLVARAMVKARVELPLERSSFGSVTGRVVDGAGHGISRARVICGYVHVYADASGAFVLPGLPAGEVDVQASRNGYRTASESLEVAPGGRHDLTLELQWAEAGDLDLRGRITSSEGAPLEGVTVYLSDVAGRRTLRSVSTDVSGGYVFEALPARLAETPLRVQAGDVRRGLPTSLVDLEDGLQDAVLDIRLKPAWVRVRFLLVDAGTGAAITRCRVSPSRAAAEDGAARAGGFTGSNAEGTFEKYFEAGRWQFLVEAPDHEPQTLDVEVQPPGGVVDLEVRMAVVCETALPITLLVHVVDAGTGEAIDRCAIDLLDVLSGEAIARFQGAAEDGTYSLPAPSGACRIRVTALGYEVLEIDAVLPADVPETRVEVTLRPE